MGVLAPEKKSEVVTLYESGNKVKEIAEMFDTSTATIYKVLRKAGKRRSPAIPKEKEQEVVEGYLQQGLGGPKLAEKLGVSTGSIYRILRKNGVIPKEFNLKKLSRLDREEAVRMYEEGKSLREVANHFGCDLENIRYHLKKAEKPRRERGNRKKVFDRETQDEVIRLYTEERWSQARIAEHFGNMSQGKVSKILRKNNVDTGFWGKGPNHHSWRGETTNHGYKFIHVLPDHPFAEMRNSGGYVAEHRLVMAEKLGRPLRPNETVHHKDMDRMNNNIDNLQLRQGNHGKGAAFKCNSCGSEDISPVELA